MKVEVEIEPYDDDISINYVDGFKITCQKDCDAILIKANAEGLNQLANICLTLAQNDAPNGSHLHLDEFNFLEEGSLELIISKEWSILEARHGKAFEGLLNRYFG